MFFPHYQLVAILLYHDPTLFTVLISSLDIEPNNGCKSRYNKETFLAFKNRDFQKIIKTGE